MPTKIVPQTRLAIACYVLVILGMAFLPNKVSGQTLYVDAASKWWAIFGTAIGALVTCVAVQCSVVGKCDQLAWIYTVVLAVFAVMFAAGALTIAVFGSIPTRAKASAA